MEPIFVLKLFHSLYNHWFGIESGSEPTASFNKIVWQKIHHKIMDLRTVTSWRSTLQWDKTRIVIVKHLILGQTSYQGWGHWAKSSKLLSFLLGYKQTFKAIFIHIQLSMDSSTEPQFTIMQELLSKFTSWSRQTSLISPIEFLH